MTEEASQKDDGAPKDPVKLGVLGEAAVKQAVRRNEQQEGKAKYNSNSTGDRYGVHEERLLGRSISMRHSEHGL